MSCQPPAISARCPLTPNRSRDITKLESKGDITWPEHTSKCFRDDESGECLTYERILEVTGEAPADDIRVESWMFSSNEHSAEDYFRDLSSVPQAANMHSLGASKSLAWDEYPLEIQ